MPELLPNRLFEVFDIEGKPEELVFGLVCKLLLGGFVNASNIVDGANGLLDMPSVFLMAHNSKPMDGHSIFFVVLFCFWLINIFGSNISRRPRGLFSRFFSSWRVLFDLYDGQGVGSVFSCQFA